MKFAPRSQNAVARPLRRGQASAPVLADLDSSFDLSQPQNADHALASDDNQPDAGPIEQAVNLIIPNTLIRALKEENQHCQSMAEICPNNTPTRILEKLGPLLPFDLEEVQARYSIEPDTIWLLVIYL